MRHGGMIPFFILCAPGFGGKRLSARMDPSEIGHQELLNQYRELAELAGSLAHEIKNPLSVIRMNMDLLAEDFADPKTPQERRARGNPRPGGSAAGR